MGVPLPQILGRQKVKMMRDLALQVAIGFCPWESHL